MSRNTPDRFRPPPVPDRSYSGPTDRAYVARLVAEVAQLERDLSERDRQVVSLEAEVRRLTALLPRCERKSHPKPTRREKIMANGTACH